MPTIDFSDIPDLEPVPDGDYPATIVFAENAVSKAGQPMINFRWAVEYEGQQRMVFDSMSFHPNALWRTKLVLKALGFEKDFSGEIEPEDLIDREAVVSVKLEKDRVNKETGEKYDDRNSVVKVRAMPAGSQTW